MGYKNFLVLVLSIAILTFCSSIEESIEDSEDSLQESVNSMEGESPTQQEVNKIFSFEQASYSEVWNATISTLSELNIPPQNINKDPGYINTS